jgi:hypothetical protein
MKYERMPRWLDNLLYRAYEWSRPPEDAPGKQWGTWKGVVYDLAGHLESAWTIRARRKLDQKKAS